MKNLPLSALIITPNASFNLGEVSWVNLGEVCQENSMAAFSKTSELLGDFLIGVF